MSGVNVNPFTQTYLLDGTPYTNEIIRDAFIPYNIKRYGCYISFEDELQLSNNVTTDLIRDTKWGSDNNPTATFCINDYDAITAALDESKYTEQVTTDDDLIHTFNEFQYLDSNGEWQTLTDEVRSKLLSTASEEVTVSDRTLHLRASYIVNEFDVELKLNDGTDSVYETQTVKEGLSITEPSVPVRDKYTFVGWYADSACTVEYDFNTPVTSDVVLYAKWKQWDADIQFVDATGKNLLVVKGYTDVKHNALISEPSIEDLSLYCDDMSYYKDADCTVLWDFDTDTINCLGDNDVIRGICK